MKIAKKALMAGILCILGAAGYFVYVSVHLKEVKRTVVCALIAIPDGMVIESESIALKQVKVEEVPDGALTSLADAAGRLSLGVAAGQVIVHKNHQPGLSGSATGNENQSRSNQPADSSQTKGIYTSGEPWTPSKNVITLGGISGKARSDSACTIEIGKAFMRGKVAYFRTSLQDVSDYDQLAFFIKPNENISSGEYRIDFCSDAKGETPVIRLALPHLTKNEWNRVLLDNGAKLGCQTQSIRLWCVNGPSTVTLTIDSIFACKTGFSDKGNQ